MNILISWIGRHDCESSTRQVEPFGPIESIVSSEKYHIDEIYGFYQARYVDDFDFDMRRYSAKLNKKYGCKVFSKAIDDDVKVSDIGEMHEILKKEITMYLHYKKSISRLFINTSSGTNAITVSLIMLGRTIYESTLLQTWADVAERKSGVEEVNFPFQISYDILRKQLPGDTQTKRAILYNNQSLNVIIGKCEKILDAKRDTIQYSIFDRNLLIVGESGTGKELFAALFKSSSIRDSKKFFAFNCANLSDQLAESELFGHKKGSFTDAKADKDGLFKTSDGGILFLDEIGELSENLQAKLLRVLEDGLVKPLGSNKYEKVDVRVIGATNSPQKLRLDLYYRLAEGVIDLPPLRERGKDSILIAEKILEITNDELKRITISRQGLQINYIPKSFDKSAYDFILSYPWSGNVRELKTVIKRCCILNADTIINEDTMQKECFKRFYANPDWGELQLPIRDDITCKLNGEFDLMSEMKKIKMKAINESIRINRNLTQAARSLGFKSLQAMKNHISSKARDNDE